jgi:hypothetical protein
VSRALNTIDQGRDPRLRMLRQPKDKQMDYYYTQLLGKDWQKQFEQVGTAGARGGLQDPGQAGSWGGWRAGQFQQFGPAGTLAQPKTCLGLFLPALKLAPQLVLIPKAGL